MDKRTCAAVESLLSLRDGTPVRSPPPTTSEEWRPPSPASSVSSSGEKSPVHSRVGLDREYSATEKVTFVRPHTVSYLKCTITCIVLYTYKGHQVLTKRSPCILLMYHYMTIQR